LLPAMTASHSPGRRNIKEALTLVAIALFGVALARPQWGQTAEVTQAVGEDILFVLDCSKSMLASDVKPNRLTRAKFAIQDFVQQHGKGRIGLVAFAGQAFLQCPLTFDYDAFREALMAVDQTSIPVPGTDIGRALDEAVTALEKNARRKIIVLLTDGEDLQKTGVKKAMEMAEQHVVIYTIGMGTTSGSQIPLQQLANGQLNILKDAEGRDVETRLDDVTLRAIATATKGVYQPLGSLGEGMSYVRNAVESPGFLHSASQTRKLGVDRFHFFVGSILCLLILESLLGTRRKFFTKAS
jgi:Ca-activated chloride channel homolog